AGFSPAVAQFWATHAENQPAAAERPFANADEPNYAAPSGRASSLGGSGATGADSVGILPERDTGFDLRTWSDTQFALVLDLTEALPERIDSAAGHEL